MKVKICKFVTREYVRVNSSSDTYNENTYNDYSDAYILVKGTITVTTPGANNGANNIRDKKK